MNEEIKAIKFKNFSDEDFTCSWDKVPYKFKAGMEIYAEDWKANHFAKHLIDRELNKKGALTNDKVARGKMLELALPVDEEITQSEMIDVNEKTKITKKQKADEVEFAGLKNYEVIQNK